MKNEIQDNEDIHQTTESMLKKIQDQMKITDDVLKSTSYRKSTTFAERRPFIDRQNIVKIKDSSLEFVNIDEDFIKKPSDSIFDEVCSICSSKIYYQKYLCVICKDCIICQNCEASHIHPVIKWKNNQLNSLYSIFLFLSNNNKSIQKLKSGFFSSNKTKYEFRLESKSLEFSIKPLEKTEIPITIICLNRNIDCKKLKLVLFGSNIKDLIIYEKQIENKARRGEAFNCSISIKSSNFCKIYNFNIGLYSTENIDVEYNMLSFKLKVFIDYEEEELNDYFKDFPSIIKESKNIKKSIKKIKIEGKIEKDPMIILSQLKQNKGDINNTIKDLTSN